MGNTSNFGGSATTTYSILANASCTRYRDADGDGHGDVSSPISGECTQPAGYVASSDDCNDSNAAIHPGAQEVAGNAVDENCDGVVAPGCLPGTNLWSSSTSGDDLKGVSATADGSMFVVGTDYTVTPGGTGAYVRRYTTAGQQLWSREILSRYTNPNGPFGLDLSSHARGIGVSTDGSGNAYVVGSVSDGYVLGQTGAGGEDVFVRKYDGSGNELWIRQFGTASHSEGTGIICQCNRSVRCRKT